MNVGYLHLTQSSLTPVSGVTRYGQHLAKAARDTLTVTEAILSLSSGPQRWSDIAKTLMSVDIIHVQYSKFLWHWNLLAFLKQLSAPVVVTLHDIHPHLYPAGNWLQLLWQENQRQRALTKVQTLALRSTWRQTQRYRQDRRDLQTILTMADRVLTCHQCEKAQLRHLPGYDLIQIIPHYVEVRSHLLSTAVAKSKLGLEQTLVVTLQGYIYRTKGHKLVIQALPFLPDNIQLVFAGGPSPGNEPFLEELLTLAKKLGVAHRLQITGYVPDMDLDLYLAASDLAICPFQSLSASGSLSTWIATGKPILASDLPQIQDYNQYSNNAIQTFSPHTPEALAEAIQTCLRQSKNNKIQLLRQQLELKTIMEQHKALYNQLL